MSAKIYPMKGVQIIETPKGSHVSPAYRSWWTENKKIAWQLGVLVARGGPKLMAYDSNYHRGGKPVWPRHYGVTGHNHSVGCGELEDTMRSITDFGIGYDMARVKR